MATRDTYEVQDWEDLPSETTPISGERLRHIEQGISDAMDNRALKEIYGDGAISLGRKDDTNIGDRSMAAGGNVEASGIASQAIGINNTASGRASYAGGEETTASAYASRADGIGTIANGNASYAGGYKTIASGNYQRVKGKFNEEDTNNQYADIVGGGTSETNRKNIYTLDWQGNAEFAGDVKNGQGVSLNSLKESVDYIMSIIQPEEGGETT